MDTSLPIYILVAIGLLVVSYILLRHLPRLMDLIFDRVPGFKLINKTLAYFVSDSFGTTIVGAGVFYAVSKLPQSAQALAMLITIGSGAFIFISEGWLGDALAGMSLQLFPQFGVDDWVTLGGDKRGKVVRLGLFRTQLYTVDLDIISVKNTKVLSEDIINHTGLYLRRLSIIIHTAGYGEFGTDIHAYKSAILRVAQQVQDKICPEAREQGRSPVTHFMEFGSSSDHFNLFFYTYDRDDAMPGAIDAMHMALAADLRPRGVVLGQVNANTIENAIALRVTK
jgi:small-conductance mechanosensitive channel